MQLDIQARGFELTESLRDHTKRRLGFAFDWTRHDVRRITVRLSDVNGPRGGEDKRCLIQIPLAGKQDIVVDDIEADLYVAIDKAVNRVERALAKRKARSREHSHANLKTRHADQFDEPAEYDENVSQPL